MLFSWTDTEASSSVRQLAFLYRADTMSMMPPEEVERIDRRHIHQSS